MTDLSADIARLENEIVAYVQQPQDTSTEEAFMGHVEGGLSDILARANQLSSDQRLAIRERLSQLVGQLDRMLHMTRDESNALRASLENATHYTAAITAYTKQQ